jgi:hypothetical protein
LQYKPQYLVAVPRLLETIYRGVLGKFAGEKPVKRRLISFFTTATMMFVKARRVLKGLLIRDKPPSLAEKVLGTFLSCESRQWFYGWRWWHPYSKRLSQRSHCVEKATVRPGVTIRA